PAHPNPATLRNLLYKTDKETRNYSPITVYCCTACFRPATGRTCPAVCSQALFPNAPPASCALQCPELVCYRKRGTQERAVCPKNGSEADGPAHQHNPVHESGW